MAAPMMGKGRELPLAAPLTGMGREMRVVVDLWRAGRVSLEAWEVWGWFWDVGDGDRGGKLAGNASRGPGLRRG